MKIRTRIFMMFLLLALPPAVQAESSAQKKLYEKESLYQYIAVIEDLEKKERYIFNNKRSYMQGGMHVDAPDKLLFEYTQMAFIGLAFLEKEPGDALFIGLGAGAMPRYFNRFYPAVTADVVEIDPDIADVAKRFFHFRETNAMRVHIADGRMFIKRAKKKYDIIFLDAYQTDFIPFHLTTVEFLREVSRSLKDGGVVVSNIVSPTKNKFFYSMIRTYTEAFPHLYIFKGKRSKNFIFVATRNKTGKTEEAVAANAKKIQSYRKFDFSLPEISASYAYSSEYAKKAELLTDDFAPVNIYQHMEVK